MPLVWKALIVAEWCVLGVVALYATLSFAEIFHAWNALPCGTPGAGASCYPWGAEGPVAGVWSYASRENYLATVIASVAVLSPAVAAAPWLRPGYRILAAVAAVLALKVADPLVRALAEALR